uniref:Uncharacterized protein n=1 Tax=Oryza rufipogon TaxID=4529 RepID=A0A0E0QKM4_ORYRU
MGGEYVSPMRSSRWRLLTLWFERLEIEAVAAACREGLLISIYDDDVYSKHGFLAQELFTLPPGVTIMQARLRKALEWKTKRTAL